jgi:hypothetical protein
MICTDCAEGFHALCPGCTCQHAGTPVPYLDKDARHKLMLEHAGHGDHIPVAADLVIRSNGTGGGDG